MPPSTPPRTQTPKPLHSSNGLGLYPARQRVEQRRHRQVRHAPQGRNPFIHRSGLGYVQPDGASTSDGPTYGIRFRNVGPALAAAPSYHNRHATFNAAAHPNAETASFIEWAWVIS